MEAGGPSLRPGADEIGVWLVELDAGLESQAEIDEAEPGPELEVLDADERVRAARFVRARDRRRFARCRSALREILGGLVRRASRSRSGSGRWRAASPSWIFPQHRRRWPPVRFNVSHSSDLAVIAVCREP